MGVAFPRQALDADRPVCHLAERLTVIGNVDFGFLGGKMRDSAAHRRHFTFKAGKSCVAGSGRGRP